jgi:hypothetical protein
MQVVRMGEWGGKVDDNEKFMMRIKKSQKDE